jgi:AraC family transcriptional regulator
MDPTLSPGSFFGRNLRRREVAGFTLSESAYPPDARLPKHSHARPYYSILLHGTYTETYGRRTRECRPSTAVFHPPGEVHADHFLARGGRLFRFEIDPLWMERLGEHAPALTCPAEARSGELSWLGKKLYGEFRRNDRASSLAIEGIALEIMAGLARRGGAPPEGRPPRWFAAALDLIRERFEEELGLGSIAASIGVHPVHLARVFRRFQGCTVGEYVRSLRLESAARKLAGSQATLAEIAVSSGFADQSHFSKCFKKTTGYTPARYRARFRPH